jgi:ferredoxin
VSRPSPAPQPPERQPERIAVALKAETTVAQLAERYGIPRPVLRDVFDLHSAADLDRPVSSFGVTAEVIERELDRRLALASEDASKDWRKIAAKFALWAVFLAATFALMRRRSLIRRRRLLLYGAAVFILGVVLGPEPSPMGTVKDAVHLLGAKGVLFPPRMVALGCFLLVVIVANKSICGWGCQFGVLQDLLFRLGHNDRDVGPGLLRQYKLPFALTNAIRAATFAAMLAASFALALDILEPVNPFRVFNPTKLGAVGAASLGALLVASLLVYRPWCGLFCPFGLLGWLAEKVSLFRIRVDYGKCIGCEACARACPSPVMAAILRQDRMTIPDCFSCGSCIEACPTGAVSFSRGGRAPVPEGKFAGGAVPGARPHDRLA